MNVTKLTEKYISEHPGIRDCVSKGIVNYSALSREICEASSIKRFDAVLIACRRYARKIKKEPVHEENIRRLLKSVKLRVRNKIAVAIIEKPRDMEQVHSLEKTIRKQKGDFNLIEGEEVITIVTNTEYMAKIKELFPTRLIRHAENLVQLSLVFDEKIETTPGVVSFVYSLLSENGINILEEMSCWTDLMIIIEEGDLAKTMRALSF